MDERRPRAAPVYLSASRLAAGMDATVFGFNDQSSGFDFYVFTVGATGFTHQTYPDLVSGFNNQIFYSARDRRVYVRTAAAS